MDDLRFYVLFNSILVISGRCSDDNERLCSVELCLQLRRFPFERGSNSVRQISRPAFNPLSYQGSLFYEEKKISLIITKYSLLSRALKKEVRSTCIQKLPYFFGYKTVFSPKTPNGSRYFGLFMKGKPI